MSIDWEKIRREEWPILEKITFLDTACVSFAPQRTVRAIKDFADFTARQDEANSSEHHIAMDHLRDKAYAEAARLLNADKEEIAVVESTTHGLNVAATSLPVEDGDNIVTTNLEFIQVVLPWCAMRKTKNIDIRIVKTENERFFARDFEALCDKRTKMIVISSVEWCNGWKMDLAEIGAMCKKHGIYLVVDAVQQLGVGKIDVKKCHVDILTSGGHKWLNSPYGAGVLYINKELLDKREPVFWGYLNTKAPEEGWGAYWENPSAPPVNDWEFVPTARRFEIGGTSNYPGAIALGESLEMVNEIGIENIERRIFDISTYCLDMWESLGGTAITHRDADHRSGIVITRLYDDLSVDRSILKNLHSRNIFIAQRFTDFVGGFRTSCQFFNNERDIDTLGSALREEIEHVGRTPDYRN
jgi:selenocysteine lyase/cysteine desulfurase